MRVTPRNELGQLVSLKKKKKKIHSRRTCCKVKKQRTELGSRLFPGPPGGVRPLKTASPSQRVPRQAGIPRRPAFGLRLLKPFLRPRRPGSLPSVRRSLLGTETSRCPARRRSRAAAASPAPPTTPGVWPSALRLRRPSLPGPPRPSSARGAKPATREHSAARGAGRGARRAAARAVISARSEPALQLRGLRTPAPWLPRDPAPAPGSGRRRCSFLACRASPRRRMVRSVERPRGGGPRVAHRVSVGKAKSPGRAPGTSPEHGHLGRERGERQPRHPGVPSLGSSE